MCLYEVEVWPLRGPPGKGAASSPCLAGFAATRVKLRAATPFWFQTKNRKNICHTQNALHTPHSSKKRFTTPMFLSPKNWTTYTILPRRDKDDQYASFISCQFFFSIFSCCTDLPSLHKTLCWRWSSLVISSKLLTRSRTKLQPRILYPQSAKQFD